MNLSEGFLSLDIKSYIEYLKEFKYRTIETANPISIKERVENLILPRVMEVLISKVIASLTRACMIYLSEAAQYLKTWMTVVARSNLLFMNQKLAITAMKLYLELFALEKKRVYNLSITLFNEVKKKADSKLILVDLNSLKKVKRLQLIRTSKSNKSHPSEKEKQQCQYNRNQQLRCGKISASERIYTTTSNCNSAELQEICRAQEDCEDCRRTEVSSLGI